MLYGDFKKQYNNDQSEFLSESKIEDSRTETKVFDKQEKKKKSTAKKVFKSIFIIILIAMVVFSAVLLYFDLFSDEGIDKVFDVFAQKVDVVYCLSAGTYQKMSEAVAVADNMKLKGCAGYVHYDGGFNVLVSFYLDKNSASDVANKLNYQIIEFYKSSKIKSVPSSLKGEYDKCKDFETKVLSGLYQASVEIQTNKNVEASKEIIDSTIATAQSDTNDFLQVYQKHDNMEVQKYAAKIKQSLSRLSSLQSELTLSNVRFTAIYITILFS